MANEKPVTKTVKRELSKGVSKEVSKGVSKEVSEPGVLIAKAIAFNLPISIKKSTEVCNFIRNKKLHRAKKILSEVIEKKLAVPFKRYNMDRAHRTGIAAGAYPIKTASYILKVLQNVEANAENKGLDTTNLKISHLVANKGNKTFHFGRKRRRKMKRTHIEIKVQEIQETQKKSAKTTKKTKK